MKPSKVKLDIESSLSLGTSNLNGWIWMNKYNQSSIVLLQRSIMCEYIFLFIVQKYIFVLRCIKALGTYTFKLFTYPYLQREGELCTQNVAFLKDVIDMANSYVHLLQTVDFFLQKSMTEDFTFRSTRSAQLVLCSPHLNSLRACCNPCHSTLETTTQNGEVY